MKVHFDQARLTNAAFFVFFFLNRKSITHSFSRHGYPYNEVHKSMMRRKPLKRAYKSYWNSVQMVNKSLRQAHDFAASFFNMFSAIPTCCRLSDWSGIFCIINTTGSSWFASQFFGDAVSVKYRPRVPPPWPSRIGKLGDLGDGCSWSTGLWFVCWAMLPANTDGGAT